MPVVGVSAPLRPLRVLTFLHSFENGGVERVALRLHAAWTASGVDARLMLGRADGAMRSEHPGLRYRLLGSGGVSTARFETLWMIARLPRVIRHLRPDVLFCAGNTYTVVAVAMRLLLGRRCPPIVAKVSNDLGRRDLAPPVHFAYRAWLRIQGRLIDHFVGMAPPMREEIMTCMGVGAERVTIIDNPSISQAQLTRLAGAREQAQRDHAGRRFVAVGRLVPQKNFALLLSAFAEAGAPDDRLTILGEGPERPSLQRLADRLGLGARLRMPGHVHPLDPWLADADAFVLSSDYEGLPSVIVEALAAGLPVIATDCSVGMSDLLGGGQFGQLVAVGDVAALANAMATIVDQSFPVREARLQASRFTVERAAGVYLDVMRRCCAAEFTSE